MDRFNWKTWAFEVLATGGRLTLAALLLMLFLSAPPPGFALGVHDALAFGLLAAPLILAGISLNLYLSAFRRRGRDGAKERFAQAASWLFSGALWSSIGGTAVQAAFPIQVIHLTLPMQVFDFLAGGALALGAMILTARFLAAMLMPFGWGSVRKMEKVLARFQSDALANGTKGGPVSR